MGLNREVMSCLRPSGVFYGFFGYLFHISIFGRWYSLDDYGYHLLFHLKFQGDVQFVSVGHSLEGRLQFFDCHSKNFYSFGECCRYVKFRISYVNLLICPGVVQESDVLLSPKNIASGNGQSSDGNLLRCNSCPRFPDYHARSRCPHILYTLTSDSTPCVDSVCYLRYRLQKPVRSLETLGRIFLKEFPKEDNDRLGDGFKFFER